MSTRWTADDVSRTLSNPIYAGMGPYPAIVSDEQWLDTNVKRIEEEGAKPIIRSVLARFREAFPGLRTPASRLYTRQAKTNPRAALGRLLSDLRELAAQTISDSTFSVQRKK